MYNQHFQHNLTIQQQQQQQLFQQQNQGHHLPVPPSNLQPHPPHNLPPNYPHPHGLSPANSDSTLLARPTSFQRNYISPAPTPPSYVTTPIGTPQYSAPPQGHPPPQTYTPAATPNPNHNPPSMPQPQPVPSNANANGTHPPSPPVPLSVLKSFTPYFDPSEVRHMVAVNGGKMSWARVEKVRQSACAFADGVGVRLGFPRRTIATAQVLYHRFHLFFPLKDFDYHDVVISCLLVSSKLEDTLKKLREIQSAAYQIRRLEEGSSLSSAEAEPEPSLLEGDRGKLIGIERLILETVCFNFNLGSLARFVEDGLGGPGGGMEGIAEASGSESGGGTTDADILASWNDAIRREEGSSPINSSSTSTEGRGAFAYVVKCAKTIGAPRALTKRAFRLAIDAHRTLVPLSFPPHTIAASCLYLATFLNALDDRPEGGENVKGKGKGKDDGDPASAEGQVLGEGFMNVQGWEEGLEVDVDDVEEICHTLLDLFISLSPSSSTSHSTLSTKTSPESPSDYPSKAIASSSSKPVINGLIDFTRVKIRLRDVASERDRLRDKDRKDASESLTLPEAGPSNHAERMEVEKGSLEEEEEDVEMDDGIIDETISRLEQHGIVIEVEEEDVSSVTEAGKERIKRLHVSQSVRKPLSSPESTHDGSKGPPRTKRPATKDSAMNDGGRGTAKAKSPVGGKKLRRRRRWNSWNPPPANASSDGWSADASGHVMVDPAANGGVNGIHVGEGMGGPGGAGGAETDFLGRDDVTVRFSFGGGSRPGFPVGVVGGVGSGGQPT